MKNLYLFALLLVLSGCIKEVDFDPKSIDRLLVVDGRVTTNPDQQLRLSWIGRYGGERGIPVGGANIVLKDDAGLDVRYDESDEEPGLYELQGVRGQVGRTYQLEIHLANDEQVYRSRPEKMPPVPEVDSISYSLVYEEFQEESGIVQEKWFMNASVHTTLVPQEVGPYLRWEVETVHNFVELLPPIPPGRPFVCYIREVNEPQWLRLFNGSGVSGAQAISSLVARRRATWVFEFRHYFNVYQSSLTKEAFRYWTDVDRVSNQVGNIFNTPPAAVQGNVSNTENSAEIVLGYFSASAIDTGRVFTTSADLKGVSLLPYCGNSFVRPSPLPSPCFNCRELPNSSYERPDYF